jgi:hypothetical protein
MTDKPYTLNIIYTDGEIVTVTYATMTEAVREAREEVKWESTVHATVAHEPTGGEIYDAPGDFNYLRS